jgi:hypothetical protein
MRMAVNPTSTEQDETDDALPDALPEIEAALQRQVQDALALPLPGLLSVYCQWRGSDDAIHRLMAERLRWPLYHALRDHRATADKADVHAALFDGSSDVRVLVNARDCLATAPTPQTTPDEGAAPKDVPPGDADAFSPPRTLVEWAVIFEKHPNTLARWFKNGTIRARKVGKSWRVATDELP